MFETHVFGTADDQRLDYRGCVTVCGGLRSSTNSEGGGRDYVSLCTPSTVMTTRYNFHQKTTISFHHEQEAELQALRHASPKQVWARPALQELADEILQLIQLGHKKRKH